MKKIIPEQINIFQINLFKSGITATSEYLEQPIKPGNIRVDISQSSAFNFDLKNVRIRLEILLNGVDDKDKLIGIKGEFGLEFQIHVENLDTFTEEVEGINKVSSILGSTLISIAYSTARGIIFQRTLGTLLNGIILPVIDPKDVLREGLEDGGSAKHI